MGAYVLTRSDPAPFRLLLASLIILYLLTHGLGTLKRHWAYSHLSLLMVQVFNLCFLGGKLAQIGVFGAAGLLGTGLVLATLPLG